jgi:hypothetical protein
MCPFTEDDRHQTLRHYPNQRGGNQVVLRTHVDHAADGLHRVVGVQRGENQMPRERGLNANLQRLTVTDFANHDDVGVVAQDGASVGETNLVMLLATLETISCHAEHQRSVSEPQERFFASLRMTDDVVVYCKFPHSLLAA